MLSKSGISRGVGLFAGASSLAIMLAAAMPAAAQTAPEATVVVTASRVERAGFTAPTPTAVQSAAVLQAQAFNNVNDLLEQAPAIHGSADQHTFNTNQNNLYTNPAATYVSLRNLGNGQTGSAARTLTLVDGNRFVFQSTGGAVNINSIPTIALDRTEIVTGGSSAAYGSEAVAGVINLILKKNYEGLQFDVSGGVSTYSDDKSAHLGVLAGHSFMGGKLHVMGALEYNSNAGIGPLRGNARPWAADADAIISGVGNGSNSFRYLTNHLQTSARAYGGLITNVQAFGSTTNTSVTSTASSSPFHGITFNADGSLRNFVYGNLFGNPNNATMSGGDAFNAYNNNNDTAWIMLPSRRLSGVFRAGYDLTDHVQSIFTLNWAKTSTDHATVSPLYPNGNGIAPVNFRVQSGNPLIPTQLQTMMTTNNIQYVTLGTTVRDFGALEDHGDDTTYQANLDFKGDFGALNKTWTWDAHGSYGQVVVNTAALNMIIDANLQNALDVVSGPSGPMCNNAAARAAGCVPFNPFGSSNVNGSNTALDKYLHAVSSRRDTTSRADLAANLRGEPISTWAGPVSMAIGGEYRRDTISVASDALSQARAFYSNNNQAFAGNISVVEGYAEAVIPLLKDVFLAKNVDFDGSLREAHYDKSGNTFSYKAGGTWAFNNDLRVRASISQDSRAPNVTELFSPAAPGAAQINIKVPTTAQFADQAALNAKTTAQISAAIAGNPISTGFNTIGTSLGNLALLPEVSHTFTYGAIWSPTVMEWMRGFRFSADYYDIKIDNAVFTPTAQTIATNCQTLQTDAACSNLQYTFVNGSPNMTELLKPSNIASIRSSGVDLVADYATPLSRFWASAPGNLTASYSANYIEHLVTVLNGVATERAGEVGGGVFSTDTDSPRWVWDANFNYKLTQYTLNLHVHYVGGGVLDNSAKPGGANFGLIQSNSVPSRTYYNLGFQYELPKSMSWGTTSVLYVNVNNVLNTAPPAWGRDPTLDIIGRFYTVGFRLKL